jgi:bifunctional UDP-N-acetylglucosamine pyrophosphorylase/glucosamine-1-phosphate N-acetyltransferase
MVDWVLAAVQEAGAKDVKVIANPHHADVAAHLDGRAQIVYQRDPKGTAHALQQIPAGELRGRQVLVVNGDSPLLTAASITKVIEAHLQAKAPATIASVIDPSRPDGRILRDAARSLDRIVERKDQTPEIRAQSDEINVGLYCFDGSRLVDEIGKIGDANKAGEFYLTDVFLHLKPVTIVTLDDPREAMGVKGPRPPGGRDGDPSQAAPRRADAGRRHHRRPRQHVHRRHRGGRPGHRDRAVHGAQGRDAHRPRVQDRPHVYIEDAKIGDRSDCGPFAKLRPGTEVAEDVHIGSFAEIVRSRIGRGSRVPHVSYLGDTDLGANANIGAGTITANFDGQNKNRTEIGDGAFVGVDTMLVAPVKLARGARTGAGSVVTKDIPDGAMAVGVPARVVRRKKVPRIRTRTPVDREVADGGRVHGH